MLFNNLISCACVLRMGIFLGFIFVISVVSSGLSLPALNNTGGNRYVCPPGFDQYSDQACAHASYDYMTLIQARGYCIMKGSQLMEVHSHTDQQLLEMFMKGHYNKYAWLGGSDQKVEGSWRWDSGHPMNYVHWVQEPHPDMNKNCLGVAFKNDYFWADYNCEKKEHLAFCKYCMQKGACPSNQIRKFDGCCYCQKDGHLALSNSDICVGQSSYSPLGQPEFVYDSDSKTYLHTGIEKEPWVEFSFPTPVQIHSIVIELRENENDIAFCSREHHLSVYLYYKSQSQLCGTYEGHKKGHDCDGKLHIIRCKTSILATHVKLQIESKPINQCSKVQKGELCVEDDAYLGIDRNVIQLSEISFSTE